METKFIQCRTSRVSKVGRFAALFLYPLGAVLLLITAVVLAVEAVQGGQWMASKIILTLLIEIYALVFSLLLLKFSVRCYRMENCRIAMDHSGFTVKGRKNRRYEWNKIGGIGIIAFGANAGRDIYQKEICIFLEPVEKEHLKKLSRSYIFGAYHPDRFILLDYEPGLADTVAKYSGLSVVDHRGEQQVDLRWNG